MVAQRVGQISSDYRRSPRLRQQRQDLVAGSDLLASGVAEHRFHRAVDFSGLKRASWARRVGRSGTAVRRRDTAVGRSDAAVGRSGAAVVHQRIRCRHG